MPFLCRLGFHKHEWLELDRTPTYGIMVIHNQYIDRCPRCGREKYFTFYIERS